MPTLRPSLLLIITTLLVSACTEKTAAPPAADRAATEAPATEKPVTMQRRLDDYAEFALTADLSHLSDNQKAMLPLLIEASDIMDDLFWRQAFGGEKEQWLASLPDDATRTFAIYNYGPWDRLNGDAPFVDGIGAKPLGANFYPTDMSVEEFEAASLPGKDGLYTHVRRDAAGELTLTAYSGDFSLPLQKASALLRKAAALADDPGFKKYLQLRAAALLDDQYRASDLAWLDMKNNKIDLVIGPIENYEDALFGYKTAYEAYVLIKDTGWSERLAKFAAFLPELQKGLPVAAAYKSETPGTDSDLNAYDVIYYAGHSNAGSKTIAINLPNDEQVQLQKGTRRLQLKNAMQAKFEKILLPISEVLIAEDQRKHITFDAFFANTMFHEVAHGLGIKNTVDGSSTVRAALKDVASSIEEGKADILGLYMITRLHEQGELGDTDLMDNYTTFMASVFRSIRFGASSAHGKANMLRFNFFRDQGAFTRESDGRYRINFEAMQKAMAVLSATLLTLQGDGDYQGASEITAKLGVIGDELQADLDRLSDASIPVDIVFRQGVEVLGL